MDDEQYMQNFEQNVKKKINYIESEYIDQPLENLENKSGKQTITT